MVILQARDPVKDFFFLQEYNLQYTTKKRINQVVVVFDHSIR